MTRRTHRSASLSAPVTVCTTFEPTRMAATCLAHAYEAVLPWPTRRVHGHASACPEPRGSVTVTTALRRTTA